MHALLCACTLHSLSLDPEERLTWDEPIAQPTQTPEPKRLSFSQFTNQIPKPVKDMGVNAINRLGNPTTINPFTAMFLGLATSGALYAIYKASCKGGDSFEGEVFSGLNIKILAPGKNQPLATRLIDGFMTNGVTAVTLGVRVGGRAYIMSEVAKTYKDEEAKKVRSGDKTVMDLHNTKHDINKNTSEGMFGQMVAAASPELGMFTAMLQSFGGDKDNKSDDPEKVKKREAKKAQLQDIFLMCCTASIKDVFDIAAFTSKVCGCDMRITLTATRFNPIEFDLPGTLSSSGTYICGVVALWRVGRFVKDSMLSKDEKESKKVKVKFGVDVFGKQYESILKNYFECEESPAQS